VNHVEDHAETEAVRRVDKVAYVAGPSVEPRWRVGMDAIVPPSELSRKFRDRHHLNGGDAEIAQFWQFALGRGKRAFWRERTDVHLVQHLTLHGDARPTGIRPFKGRGIDHFRKMMRATRLEARGGVGIPIAFIQPVFVKATGGSQRSDGFKIAILFAAHFEKSWRFSP